MTLFVIGDTLDSKNRAFTFIFNVLLTELESRPMSQLPKTMSGVILNGHGGLDQLEYRSDLTLPELTAGDVLIRIEAAGVNNTDLNTRLAWYSKGDHDSDDATWTGEALSFPHIQGIDGCGRIVAVGAGVDPQRIGERVLIEPCLWWVKGEKRAQPWFFGSECAGAFAQYTSVNTHHAHKIESDLSSVELASFPCSYSTAENMLTRAQVQAGDTVLITGASGGVGSAAIQLAKARGARVIAITSPAKADDLRALGADRCLPRDAALIDELGTDSVDVVIDLVAGPTWPDLLDVLRPRGRYAVSGAIAGPHVTLDVRTLYLKDLSFFGCTALEPDVFANLVRLIERKAIKPLVAKSYPLQEIAQAQIDFAEKNHIGKLVLKVD